MSDSDSNVIAFPATRDEASMALAAGTLEWADPEAAQEWIDEVERREAAGEPLDGLDLPEMVIVTGEEDDGGDD